MNPAQKGAFLSRLARETAGNTLAIAAASIFALMGVVGGAVDISRTYMAQSRLQQACDAGALAARKALAGERLTDAEKATGYRYFDFNFPAGSYGVTLTSRTYSQPVNSAGTPQAIVNGTVIATVPTTIMKIFGKDTVDLTINCSSKMEITNADVAMVLDVTLSMDFDMTIGGGVAGTEPRLAALRRAVKAFYDALGPGRAGGDLSKGRIRYGFVPYGITVNTASLLSNDQMVDSWSYESREAVSETVHTWTTGAVNYGDWSSPTDAYSDDAAYSSTYNVVSGSDSTSYTMQDGRVVTRKKTGVTSAQCDALNDFGTQDDLVGLQQTESTNTNESITAGAAPVWPAATQSVTASETRTATVTYGYRYRWSTAGGGSSNACWLERAAKKTSGTPDDKYTQRRTGTTRPVTWQDYTGYNLRYGTRTINVSSLKNSGAWRDTITIPALDRSGGTAISNVKVSGSNSTTTVYSGGSAVSVPATWRGCVEERTMDNTITSGTSLDSIPSGAFDLNTNLLASTGDDRTRWRPWLSRAVYVNGSPADTDDSDCPTPALRLQEIGNYNTTILTTSYPNLFQPTSGSPASFYYPYTTAQWGTSSTPAAERTQNSATLRNYINRIKMTSGTTHDVGFIWGLHLVSGEGMFASDNPDRFNGMVVSRNIVFMTDGEMNPGEERYVFSGYNQHDGRMAPTSTNDSQMIAIENRRLRIACEAAKRQGITVWVVAITSSATSNENYSDLRACASSSGNFKTAATSTELINTFTTIAQSIGGLRISQ